AGTAPRRPAGRPARRPEAAAVAPRAAPGPEAERAEAALRAWRTERSRRDGVAPFIVLHDRHLRAVAAARPRSLVALRAVDGIGPTKLELYGEEILAALDAVDPLDA
ncbi:MAG TPA: HRDC domain-containing protein, partial [Acidimicrobiales bacterium]|nr:HRDC domain-containing protein [Acidimicrobiales bacterium]